jgi:hypothetical protein
LTIGISSSTASSKNLPHPDEPIPTSLTLSANHDSHRNQHQDRLSYIALIQNGSIKLILNNQQTFFSEPVEITSRIVYLGRKNQGFLHEKDAIYQSNQIVKDQSRTRFLLV